MDLVVKKINAHQKVLLNWLESKAAERNQAIGNELDYQVVADTQRNHYQLIALGWKGQRFVYSLLFHLDIKPDGKIWIQQNNTEALIGGELVESGVDKNDIVIGFRPEYLREGSGYAVS